MSTFTDQRAPAAPEHTSPPGTVARSRAWTAAPSSVGLRQVRPRLTGYAGSPATARTRPSATVTARPHPVPQ